MNRLTEYASTLYIHDSFQLKTLHQNRSGFYFGIQSRHNIQCKIVAFPIFYRLHEFNPSINFNQIKIVPSYFDL